MKHTLWVTVLLLGMAGCNSTRQSTQMPVITFDKQGHRGCRGLMPENTIPAMLRAIDLDVTTLEMDLAISGDKKVVVSHDPHFHENITTTPQGRTLARAEAAKLLLYQMPYDSIRRYDVGLKPHPLYPRQQKMAISKPLLSDLLQATEQYAKGKGRVMAYNIEIKSKPEGDGTKHPPVEEFVDLAVQVVRNAGVEGRTTIQSFDPRALQVMHRKYPRMVTSLLIEDDDRRSLQDQLKELGFTPQVYSPHFSLVTPELLRQCRSQNIKVIPWTINTLEEMKKQKAMGVDGIITDYPDLFAQL